MVRLGWKSTSIPCLQQQPLWGCCGFVIRCNQLLSPWILDWGPCLVKGELPLSFSCFWGAGGLHTATAMHYAMMQRRPRSKPKSGAKIKVGMEGAKNAIFAIQETLKRVLWTGCLVGTSNRLVLSYYEQETPWQETTPGHCCHFFIRNSISFMRYGFSTGRQEEAGGEVSNEKEEKGDKEEDKEPENYQTNRHPAQKTPNQTINQPPNELLKEELLGQRAAASLTCEKGGHHMPCQGQSLVFLRFIKGLMGFSDLAWFDRLNMIARFGVAVGGLVWVFLPWFCWWFEVGIVRSVGSLFADDSCTGDQRFHLPASLLWAQRHAQHCTTIKTP